MDYFAHLGILICIYVILASGLDLVVGYAGQFSLGHAAPFGIGAYTTSILLIKTNLGCVPAMLCGILLAGIVNGLIAVPGLRLKGDCFALATLGFAETLRIAALNWTPLTRGPMGLTGIPQPEFFSRSISPTVQFFILSVFSVVFVMTLLQCLVRSRFGKMLQAARDDSEWFSVLGGNPDAVKLLAMAVAGLTAGLAGALYAQYAAFIDPSVFSMTESILVVSMVILGGPGTLRGSVLGAAVLILLPEPLRLLDLPASLLGALRQILYGALLVVFMLRRPKGVWGDPWAWRVL